MAFTDNEIQKFTELSKEMATLIKDADNTSNEASVAYGKIARVCTQVLSRHAARAAAKEARQTSVSELQASRQERQEKKGKKGGQTPSPVAGTPSGTGRGKQSA
jgi:hypothetical protein